MPTTITVRCKCGELLRVDQQGAGERLKCRRCGRSGEVRHSHRTIETRASDAHRRSARKAESHFASDFVTSLADLKYRIRQQLRQRVALWMDTPRQRNAGHLRRSKVAATPLVSAVSIASWAYLAAACLIAVMVWGFGDRWWPATILLFIGRWIFLLPLVVLVPAAALLRRTLLLPLALSALVVIGPIMGFRTGWRSWLPHQSEMRFRVVTFNTDGGEQVAQMLPVLLTEWQPDVVAFQECGESLIEATRHVDGWYHHDVRALCLLSRYPIRGVSVMNRDALERVKEDEVAGIGGSGDVASYVIQTPRGSISFTNLHLETPRKGLEGLLGAFDVRRLEQNTQLRNIESSLARRSIGSGDGPIPLLLAGDFNTPVESRIFQEHWGDLTDAFSHTGFGLGMTRYNGWIRVRIDHVLTGDTWHADRTEVGPDLGSDHRPVIVDLTLDRSM